MKRKRFTEEQIVGILKEHEAAVAVTELCRKHGVSDASIYKWKAKYGGLEVSDAKRLKTLEDENGKLKRLLADAILGNTALKELLSKIYDPPRLCKGNRVDVEQLHKCIRPLASGPLLRPTVMAGARFWRWRSAPRRPNPSGRPSCASSPGAGYGA